VHAFDGSWRLGDFEPVWSTRFPLAVVTLPGASRTVLAWRSDDDTGRRAPDEPLNATVFTLLG
jgi:hypothetical protein